jgi:ABC-type nitrate/sulfonate/bicarbonate transport system substrate-binding protein
MLLKNEDLNESQFRVMNLQESDSMFAITAGNIDATLVGEPTGSTIIFKGIGKEIRNFADIDLDPNLLFVRSDYLRSHRGEIEMFLKGWLKTLDYIKNNRDDVLNLLSRDGNINIDVVKMSAIPTTFDASLTLEIIKSFKDDSEFLKNQKVVSTVPDVNNVFETEYLKEAIAQK